MDYVTIILFILLAAAFIWWFKLAFEDNRIIVRELERKRKERLLRAERVKQLVGKR